MRVCQYVFFVESKMVYNTLSNAYGPSYATSSRFTLHGAYLVPYPRHSYGDDVLTRGSSAPRSHHTMTSAYNRSCDGYGLRPCASDDVFNAPNAHPRAETSFRENLNRYTVKTPKGTVNVSTTGSLTDGSSSSSSSGFCQSSEYGCCDEPYDTVAKKDYYGSNCRRGF